MTKLHEYRDFSYDIKGYIIAQTTKMSTSYYESNAVVIKKLAILWNRPCYFFKDGWTRL